MYKKVPLYVFLPKKRPGQYPLFNSIWKIWSHSIIKIKFEKRVFSITWRINMFFSITKLYIFLYTAIYHLLNIHYITIQCLIETLGYLSIHLSETINLPLKILWCAVLCIIVVEMVPFFSTPDVLWHWYVEPKIGIDSVIEWHYQMLGSVPDPKMYNIVVNKYQYSFPFSTSLNMFCLVFQ